MQKHLAKCTVVKLGTEDKITDKNVLLSFGSEEIFISSENGEKGDAKKRARN